MEKKEILEVLKEMLADYESALIWKNDDVKNEYEYFDTFLEKKHLDYGFCSWLVHSVYTNRHYIFKELEIRVFTLEFLYPISVHFSSIETIKSRCLMPRAQHLLRAIERLENELK